MNLNHSGFVIALAWPEMFCKEVGVWYDPYCRFLGANKNHYYKVGHAALVLVDLKGNCFYFDFGRYHSPYQYGRVRMYEADPDLTIHTKAVFSNDCLEITNFKAILEELQKNPACHGDGALHAAYNPIDFDAAWEKAMEIHNAHIIPYGPFVRGGTNCSRFVNTVIRAGKPHWWKSFYLRYLRPITPTTLTNVHALGGKEVVPRLLETEAFYPHQKPSRERLKTTIPEPERPENIPTHAQWLSGEGAGSWFVLEFFENAVSVERYTADGLLEGKSQLPLVKGEVPNENQAYQIIYPCNLRIITLDIQGTVTQFDKKL